MTVEALRRGRPEVLADLLADHGDLLHGVAYLILDDSAAADDIVADTLLAALEHGRQLRDDDALRQWLVRIATNRALSYRRKSARVVQIRVLPDQSAAPDPVGIDERTALISAVSALPTRMRAAVVLRYFADLPVEGVAQAMGVSTNTVKTQLKSALVNLRGALADPPGFLEEHDART